MTIATAICAFNQNGYCKFKENCRQLHINDACTLINCSRNDCHLRHPRPCRYFRANGTCKFNDRCSYRHDKSLADDITSLRQEMNVVATSINLIVKMIEELKKASSTNLNSQADMSTNTDNISAFETITQLDGAAEEECFEFSCNTCHECFNNPDDFMIHDSFPYRCRQCSVCFPVKLAFDLHIHRPKT